MSAKLINRCHLGNIGTDFVFLHIVMTIQEAIEQRHSVRQYTDEPLTQEQLEVLSGRVGEYNSESGLHIQLITGEERAFSGLMARYGKFTGVRNYFALVGPKSAAFREKMGYYGEKLVLDAQMLGLNTCWAGLTFSKITSVVEVRKDEQYVAAISIGVGSNKGVQHKSKPVDELADSLSLAPSWYRRGVECAALAPSALTRQNFHFDFTLGKVLASNRSGSYSELDLGIAKLHFEIGSGKDSSIWSVE